MRLRHQRACDDVIGCRNIGSPCRLEQCAASYYTCADGVTCVSRATLCDGDLCNGCGGDGGSEEEWSSGPGFKCVRNGRVCRLPQSLLYDRVQDCDNEDDFCFIQDRCVAKLTAVWQSAAF